MWLFGTYFVEILCYFVGRYLLLKLWYFIEILLAVIVVLEVCGWEDKKSNKKKRKQERKKRKEVEENLVKKKTKGQKEKNSWNFVVGSCLEQICPTFIVRSIPRKSGLSTTQELSLLHHSFKTCGRLCLLLLDYAT